MVSERHQGGKAWRISFFTCSNISSTLKNSLSASLILPMCFRKLPTKSIILHLSAAVTWERLHSRTRTGRKQTGLKDTGKEQMPGLLPLQDSTAVFLIPFVGGDRLFSLFLFVTSSFGFLEITPHSAAQVSLEITVPYLCLQSAGTVDTSTSCLRHEQILLQILANTLNGTIKVYNDIVQPCINVKI